MKKFAILVACFLTFAIGTSSYYWHSQLSKISSIFSIIRGYNLVVASFALSGCVFACGIEYFAKSRFKNKPIVPMTFKIFAFWSAIQLLQQFIAEGFESGVVWYFFLQFFIYSYICLFYQSKKSWIKIIPEISTLILVTPLFTASTFNFITNEGGGFKSRFVRFTAGDPELHAKLKNNSLHGLVAYDINNFGFHGFFPSWKVASAGGFQPQVSKAWYDAGNHYSLSKTNRLFDLEM